ncbi:MAG TPA: VWA domain-containing protein [Bryobacteraceae bacterium]|jgi:VWFA-related protein
MNSRFVIAGMAAFGLCFASLSPLDLIAQEGPQSPSSDSVAKPKKKPAGDTGNTDTGNTDTKDTSDQPPIPSEFKKPKELPADTPTFRENATTVTVDVSVMDDHNHFIPRIPTGNFRVVEDGVPQRVSQFGQGEAPITICMVIEFSGRFQAFWTYGWYETLQASYGFLSTLKPDDNVAVVAFDLRTTILSDFSPDKNKAEEALGRLRIPGFSESNVFDALTDMADRMSSIDGRKAILYIGSGIDTFSKLTFDKARRSLQESGVPIYTISTLQTSRIMAESYGMSPIAQMDFLQADNEMRTFAKETGGLSFFPRFIAEYGSVFNQIETALRDQYTLSYHPTNTARDGKFRRIKVELVNPATNEPLRITNEKGKAVKYQIIAKAGYKAPHEVE